MLLLFLYISVFISRLCSKYTLSEDKAASTKSRGEKTFRDFKQKKIASTNCCEERNKCIVLYDQIFRHFVRNICSDETRYREIRDNLLATIYSLQFVIAAFSSLCLLYTGYFFNINTCSKLFNLL